MSWRKVELSALLIQIKHIVKIDNSKEYKLVTVSSKGTIKQREIVKGVEIKGEKAFEAKSGKFIYSRLSVHNGAYGIVPLELDGALLTSEMPIFEISDKILPEFLIYSLQLPTFKFQLEQLTKGVGRTRVKEVNFLSLIIDLPNISDQETIIKSLIKAEQHSGLISTELTHQLTLIKKLRQQLLQDAVQGKLVVQNKKDEPASELLKKIKAEKEKLIAEKKLKKEKELPPIKPEEIPFEIPENWVWCRLGEICTIKGGKRVANGYKLLKEATPHIYIRVSDMKNGTVDDSDLHYLDESMFQKIKQYTISKDDIYMTIVGGTIGKCGLIPEKFHNMNLTENAAKISPVLIDKVYLWKCLDSPFCQDQFIDKTKQVGVQKMALNRFSSSLIPIPPLAEQHRIVQKLDELMQYCNELEESIKQSELQNEKLLQQALREALRKEPVEAEINKK